MVTTTNDENATNDGIRELNNVNIFTIAKSTNMLRFGWKMHLMINGKNHGPMTQKTL